METHFELTDKEFEEQFAQASLDPKLFTHEAHLRLAWIHLTQYGSEQAIVNITMQLKQYVKKLGASNKYNETVTVAAIKAVQHFHAKSDTNNFQDFILKNPRLINSFRELLSSHYTTDIFNSQAAKDAFLAPELLPFD